MIAITGASGNLGRLVVAELAQKVDPASIVATARSTDRLTDLASLGVTTRRLDYNEPNTISAALDGVEQVLLISSSEVGARVAQHRAVIEAAATAQVQHLAYTSILRADISTLGLASEHRATEALLAAAPFETTRLRHGWYIENYTANLGPALANGGFIGAAGDGRIAAATRSDFAAADVAILTDRSRRGGTYELAGHAFTMSELAATVSELTGKQLPYIDMPGEALTAALSGAGLPKPLVDLLVDADLGIARGELDASSATLESLIGRSLTTLRSAVEAALG